MRQIQDPAPTMDNSNPQSSGANLRNAMSHKGELITPLQLQRLQVFSLIMPVGMLFLVAVMVGIRQMDQARGIARPAANPDLTWFACGLFLVGLPLSMVVPRLITRRALRRMVAGVPDQPANSPVPMTLHGLIMGVIALYFEKRKPSQPEPLRPVMERLLAYAHSALVTGLVILGGTCLFATIAYLNDGHWAALVVMGASIALMLARFPTKARIEKWLLDQGEQIEQLRQEMT